MEWIFEKKYTLDISVVKNAGYIKKIGLFIIHGVGGVGKKEILKAGNIYGGNGKATQDAFLFHSVKMK